MHRQYKIGDNMAKSGKEPVNISSLYADLQRFADAQSYDKALKTADTILKTDAGELEAFQYKIICLIQLNDFQNVLAAIEKNSQHASAATFEKAYAEYRLNRNQDALETLNGVQKLDLRCKELKAQLLYRLEDYEGSMKLYKDVVKNSEDDYDDERQTNVSAVTAALSMNNTELDLPIPEQEEENYDRCFNNACFLIGREAFRDAEVQLKKAEELCLESLEDEDMTEEEKEDEIAVIRVQIAYCQQMLGNNAEAMKTYNTVFKNKPSDGAVTAVAANNTVTLNQDQNVFDSKKKMKLATAPELAKKLTCLQMRSIDANNCLLAYYSNQADACRSQCKALRQKYPESDTAALVESCLLVKTRQANKAIELLEACIKESEDPSLSLQFSLAELHLREGNVSQACDVLRMLGPNSYRPAIVSLLISLYMSEEDDKSVSDYFSDVISWYDKNEADSPAYKDILKASADFQLRIKKPQLAASLLEKLRKLSPGDRGVLSMLFATYSQYDANKAKQISSELPSVESLAESIDVDTLEESSVFLSNKYKGKKDTADKAANDVSEEQIAKKKKSRKKKGKLPKEYNPDVDPDPERWLPKRERSTWKGRRRHKNKDNVGKGSQGATAGGGPELDITKMESSTSDSTSQPIPASGNKGYSASKQQQKKKKTKGKGKR